MAVVERGLGRGLDSLFGATREAELPVRDAKKLAVTQITPGAHQPRKWFNDAALAELSASIKNQGIVQPLIVRPKADSMPQLYEIVAGERRWRAAKLAGLTEVPVVITAYTDTEAMTVALVENLQRENLNPLEEAEALQALRIAHNLNQEELASKLGKSRPAIANALRLLQLPLPLQDGLAEGKISAGHARALLAIADESAQLDLYATILAHDMSVRDTEAAVEQWKRTGKLPMTEQTAESGGKKTRGIRKTQEMKDIQNALRQTVHHGASLSGDEKKGRIALPYTSRGELGFLLNLLGLDIQNLGFDGAPSVLDSEQYSELDLAVSVEEVEVLLTESTPDSVIASQKSDNPDSLSAVSEDAVPKAPGKTDKLTQDAPDSALKIQSEQGAGPSAETEQSPRMPSTTQGAGADESKIPASAADSIIDTGDPQPAAPAGEAHA